MSRLRISITVSEEEHQLVQAHAQRTNRTMANFCYHAVLAEMKRRPIKELPFPAQGTGRQRARKAAGYPRASQGEESAQRPDSGDAR